MFSRYRWPSGTVPYTISTEFTEDERAIIAAGVLHVEQNSCIRFVPRLAEPSYVDIVPGDGGCYAVMSSLGRGRLEIGLDQGGCVSTRTVVHEILHALGLHHEQKRPDRDGFISVNWNNIQAGAGPSQFFRDSYSVLPRSKICDSYNKPQGTDYSDCWSGIVSDTCGLPYDFDSIMHYRLNSFALDYYNLTMTPHNSSIVSAGNYVLSELDIAKIKCAYCKTCGGNIRAEDNGTVTVSGVNTCKWSISADNQERGIQINIKKLPACDGGSVTLYDGDEHGEATTVCGDNIIAFRSSSKTLIVSYTSNSSGDNFIAEYQQFDRKLKLFHSKYFFFYSCLLFFNNSLV